jgi:NIPSNAP
MESSLAAGAALFAAAPGALAQGQPSGKPKSPVAKPELYELKVFRLRIGAQAKLVGDYLSEFYIPLAGRMGLGPVGAFNLTFGPGMPSLYLLTPVPSLGAYEALQERIAEELPKAKAPGAAAFWSATAKEPAYIRSENQLLVAFDNLRKLVVPATTAKKEPRIFELRVYETPTDAALAKKMEMFGPKMGEMDIFKRVGLEPVLFARTLVGPQQPGFVYLLTFPDLAAREAAWKRFREDPAWLKLKATPGYLDAEIMANITDLVLTPTPYSQL